MPMAQSRIQAKAMDEKERQPTGDRPLISKLKEQQEAEQNGGDTAEIAQHLTMHIFFAIANR